MEINSLKRDSAIVAEGQWVKDIPEAGELELRVRGFTSPKAVALMNRKIRAVPKDQRGRDGQPNHAAMLRISGEVLHEACLLDWKGLTKDGKPLKYDPAVALEYLTNPDYAPFADAVAWAARAVDRGEAEVTAELAGN